MPKLKKVTVVLPADLLRRAQRTSAEGVTATIRRGLELLAAHETYQRILAMRGRVHLGLDLAALREDRR
jgi:hypothetical protein